MIDERHRLKQQQKLILAQLLPQYIVTRQRTGPKVEKKYTSAVTFQSCTIQLRTAVTCLQNHRCIIKNWPPALYLIFSLILVANRNIAPVLFFHLSTALVKLLVGGLRSEWLNELWWLKDKAGDILYFCYCQVIPWKVKINSATVRLSILSICLWHPFVPTECKSLKNGSQIHSAVSLLGTPS